ncbi:protein FAR-RED IMPAIRED RESPONSE 1-like isoform X1 [Quillaja saponaria]|uniref:Protein FAR1-RELATED SEQUENCE n=1 Tax=Quillaja saponaria TaxID=32244 RepID=A0AAD7LP62_QUISA|nr:protein FAR-RED IMPAIRED RESPONSE 1-like isoform X1 [Quillaja saponaria]
MRTWLKAVGSQAPKVMITDQDNILKEAVADVFPDTRHCFCLWHILGKVPENLGYVINQNGDFMGKFSKCIFQSWSDEQFEKRWWKLISKFELKEDEWVQLLYKDRKNWIPTYMQDLFLAGMSTTERAGSITSYFDKYLLKETTFKEFIEGYKVFIAESYDMETEADFETRQQPSLISLSPFEKQMATVYTDSIFKKFQVEILGVVSCRLHKEREDVSSVIFQVDDFEERQKFLVAWNETELDVCCLCRSFEYRGILCRHAILVIQMSGLSSIPSHYILRRWTKDAKVSQTVGDITNVLPNRLQRFNDLCRRAITLSEVGSLSQDTYKVAFQALKKVYKHCVSVNDSARTVLEPNMSTFHGFLDVAEANHGSHMAKSTKKRKTYKKKPLSEPEKITVRTQDSFQQMEHMTSRAHNLDDCYIPQQDIPAVELGSRAPTFDGYYGAQQSLQGEGQLNSISLVRDGYYSNQQAIQGLGQLHPLRTRIPHYGMQQSMQGLLQGQHCFRAPVTHGFYDIQDNLEDMEQSVESSQNRSLAPKHLHDKSLAQ